MKVLREDNRLGGLRVIEGFAYLPKLIKTSCTPDKWIFWEKYYVLQRLSYWYVYWMDEEESTNPNEWDFKWSEAYLNLWK